jgi:cytochrome c-type biogenesis protein CcmH/NrfF
MTSSDFELVFIFLLPVILIVLNIWVLVSGFKSRRRVREEIKALRNKP